MYREPRKKWRWDTWRRWLLLYAKLTIIFPEEPVLPDLELDYTKHQFGVSMGYTCSALTRRGLARKMRKTEKEAGVGAARDPGNETEGY